jgi:Na+-transporting methylmalonyl-CoA/oxaloacetate decarboxylase beta subunit
MGILYFIYLTLSVWLTLVVGNSLHKNGKVWIRHILNESPFADRLNDLLLLAFRLLNIGYILYTLTNGNKSNEVITFLSSRLGIIILTLAFLHYQNIIGILIFSYYKNKNKHKWQI